MKKKDYLGQQGDIPPSQEVNDYWIYAHRKNGIYPKPSEKTGKWLIFVNIKDVDEVWGKIKKAIEEGKLGDYAKVATEKPNPHAKNPKLKVICVYTYNWTDKEDVMHIREELRNLGITNKIPYKTDDDTLSGKYVATGYQRISKYYE
jgi:hypothetical protein